MHVLFRYQTYKAQCTLAALFLLFPSYLSSCHELYVKHNLYTDNLCPRIKLTEKDWGQKTIRIIKCWIAVKPNPFSFLFTNELNHPEIKCVKRFRHLVVNNYTIVCIRHVCYSTQSLCQEAMANFSFSVCCHFWWVLIREYMCCVKLMFLTLRLQDRECFAFPLC